MKTCLINECERKVEARGLCHPCYQSAWRYIKTRATTWEVLEADGFALPTGSKRGVEKGTFRKALESKELTPDERTLDTLKKNNKITVKANEPLIRQLEKKITLGEETLGSKLIRKESIGLQVPISESFEQDDYDPPDEAPTGCEPPEVEVQGVIETLDPSAPEPLSEPDPEIVAASMTAIEEGRTQPIENFFRYLPDLHSGQEPG